MSSINGNYYVRVTKYTLSFTGNVIESRFKNLCRQNVYHCSGGLKTTIEYRDDFSVVNCLFLSLFFGRRGSTNPLTPNYTTNTFPELQPSSSSVVLLEYITLSSLSEFNFPNRFPIENVDRILFSNIGFVCFSFRLNRRELTGK